MGIPQFTLSSKENMSIIEMDYRANEAFVIEVAKVAASMVDIKAAHAPEHFAELFDIVLKKTKGALGEPTKDDMQVVFDASGIKELASQIKALDDKIEPIIAGMNRR